MFSKKILFGIAFFFFLCAKNVSAAEEYFKALTNIVEVFSDLNSNWIELRAKEITRGDLAIYEENLTKGYFKIQSTFTEASLDYLEFHKSVEKLADGLYLPIKSLRMDFYTKGTANQVFQEHTSLLKGMFIETFNFIASGHDSNQVVYLSKGEQQFIRRVIVEKFGSGITNIDFRSASNGFQSSAYWIYRSLSNI